MRGKKSRELRYLCDTFELPYPVYKMLKKRYKDLPSIFRDYASLNRLLTMYASGFHARIEEYRRNNK